MLEKIRQTIVRRSLLRRGDRVLAAVSGGADSIAMLHSLAMLSRKLRITVAAAHLNHGIRGKSARLDAEFTRKFAATLGVTFVSDCADVPALARRKGISVEMAAREARYEFFARAAAQLRATVLATAHTADDQAETILLKLCRGTGLRGLCGIPRVTSMQGLRTVRPMLDISRKEITAYLRKNRLAWREDPTNKKAVYQRNIMRLEIIPVLERRLNPELKNTLTRTAEILSADEAWLEELTGRIYAKCRTAGGGLDIRRLSAAGTAAARRVLRRWLVGNGVPPEDVGFDTVCRAEKLVASPRPGARMEITGGLIVRRRYNALVIERAASGNTVKPFSAALKMPGATLIHSLGMRIDVCVAPGITRDKCGLPGKVPAAASISAAAVGRRKIVVRSWKKGDRMSPLGLGGTKKVQDILVDAKVPLADRMRVPVFECGRQIIWIPGYRIAAGWEVPADAGDAVQIRVEPAQKRARRSRSTF